MTQPSPPRISKINVSTSAKEFPVTIAYERDVPNSDTEAVKMPGTGQPHPDFVDALNQLADTAIGICRLSEADWTEVDRHVIGVSIKYADDGKFGLNITLMKKFEGDDGSTVAVVINTPYINPDMVTPREDRYIRDICAEAELYLKGKRAQGSLFAVA